MTTHTLAVAVAAVLIATRAGAQEARLPRVEVGAVGSGLLIAPVEDGGVLALVGGGPSITIGITQRIRVDVRAQILGPNQGTDVYGLYETVIRFPVTRSAAAPALSMTAGVSGFFSFYRFREYRTQRRDGSVIVYLPQRGLQATVPRIGSVGLAHQRIVSSRLSVLLGADALVGRGAILARGTVGLSFGTRRYR